MAQVTADLSRRPEVLEVYFLAGANDFLVHVATDRHRRPAPVRGRPAQPQPGRIAGTETNLIFEHTRAAGLRA